MTSKQWTWTIVSVVLIVLVYLGVTYKPQTPTAAPTSSSSTVLHVVAAENFWGSLVSQLGGSHVEVTSVVSDPNADPHEYESDTNDARAFADADYVIENGAGYDSWADKLVSAGGKPTRKVLIIADLVGKKDGDNPHLWYNPAFVNQAIARMDADLVALDPAHADDFRANLKTLQDNLAPYQNRIASIKAQFGGTKVAATEDIFEYLSDAAGLDLVSPPAFIQAVAEGNDPPAQSVVTFENQLKAGDVRVLVYNQQTVTPLTDSMKKLAADENIPIVGVTETIQPPDASFQDWMNAQLIALENALNARALGE